jgi:hypothetical protein
VATKQRITEAYRASNIEAARIIAADPVKYPGIMQEWARLVLNPSAERTAPAAGRAA